MDVNNGSNWYQPTSLDETPVPKERVEAVMKGPSR
jgi:hypothetical protein